MGGRAPSGAAAIGAGATLAMGCTGLKPFRYQGRSPRPVGMYAVPPLRALTLNHWMAL